MISDSLMEDIMSNSITTEVWFCCEMFKKKKVNSFIINYRRNLRETVLVIILAFTLQQIIFLREFGYYSDSGSRHNGKWDEDENLCLSLGSYLHQALLLKYSRPIAHI